MSSESVTVSAKGLYLAWCSHEAMRAALTQWYYRDAVPIGKLVRVGVWENATFSGVVTFGAGSSNALGKRWNLTPLQVCEMNRVALRPGHKAQVSRILSIAIKLLRSHAPGLRAVVTFADPEAGHHGGVYQGAGWIYTGKTADDRRYLYRGEWLHSRQVKEQGFTLGIGGQKSLCVRPSECERVERVPGKHRYVMPLDDETRALVMREARPYPKRETSPEGVQASPHWSRRDRVCP